MKMPMNLRMEKSASGADAIESDIESIKKIVNQDADAQRQKLTSAYHSSIGTSVVTILISIAALFSAMVAVLRWVIYPLTNTNREINEIISGIDNRQGDLTAGLPLPTTKKWHLSVEASMLLWQSCRKFSG